VAVVGAGLAGLSCAYSLAKSGFDVLVVERGDYPGSKNVTGGRLYMNPVRRYMPEIWDQAPFERYVTRERLSMLSENSSVTLDYRSDEYSTRPHHSYTLIRPVFDKWLSEKATEAGATIATKYKVDGLIRDGNRICGVRADGEEIGADVVVAADGALSFIAEEAGLRPRHDPNHFAVGVKETIELPRKVIEDRFNLTGDEGAAQLYFGSIAKGMTGGAFAYTNRESISLGIVVSLGSLMETRLETFQLMEEFKKRPEIAAITEGGETVEYSAHTIPEGGIRSIPRLCGDGIVVVGDAAGFALNMGIIVRGMDLAIASGAIAAEAIKKAKVQKSYSAETLSSYDSMLAESFVIKDLLTFRNVWRILKNPRLFGKYPQALNDLLAKLLFVGEEPKPRLSSTFLKEFRRHFLNLSTLRDALGLLQM